MSKICKKGYMEMTKKIYLETLKSALGRSILHYLFHCGHLLFTWKTRCRLKFHFGEFDRSEISTEVSFTTPEVMWTLMIKLPHTEVKFYPEVKSLTGLSSLRVSCKCALNLAIFIRTKKLLFFNLYSSVKLGFLIVTKRP